MNHYVTEYIHLLTPTKHFLKSQFIIPTLVLPRGGELVTKEFSKYDNYSTPFNLSCSIS